MKQISVKIKELRAQKRFSAEKLAELIGKKGANRKQYIYDLESGKIKNPDVQTLAKLAGVFGISLTELAFNGDKGIEQVISDSKVGESAEYWKDKYIAAVKRETELQAKIISLLERKNPDQN